MSCVAIERTRLRLIIGIGNPLRGDDGAGTAVVERLIRESRVTPGVESVSVPQLVPEMALRLAAASLVLFVDASPAVPVGAVRCERVSAVRQAAVLGHQLPPGDLLQLTQRAFGRHPRAWIYTIGGGRWELGDAMSEPVSRTVAQLARRLARGKRE